MGEGPREVLLLCHLVGCDSPDPFPGCIQRLSVLAVICGKVFVNIWPY